MSDFNDMVVEDGENFNSGKELNAGGISLEQFRRCCVEGSKEMNRGGLKRKVIKGEVHEIDFPNQREIFINCVDMFYIMMVPKLNSPYQKELLAEVQSIDKEKKKVEDDATTSYKKLEKDCKSDQSFFNSKIDDLNDSLEMKKVMISKKKLMALSILLEKVNYFGEGTATN